METFKKLPSGKWNLRKYDYTDSTGKKHYKSFTAETKTEIRQAVIRWQNTRDEVEKHSVTVCEAVRGYIELKENVLSPSTIRAYNSIVKTYIDDNPIGSVHTDDINTMMVQRWISGLVSMKLKPKTVQNSYGLLLAAVTMYQPELRLRVTMPQKIQPDLHCPDDNEVQKLLHTVRKYDDKVMEFCILCAAYIPARRGEVCALTYDDIDGSFIRINKAMVKGTSGEWIIKTPKTTSSYRTVEVPDIVIDTLPDGNGRIVPWTPDQLSKRFTRYVRLSGVEKFRFHDLRHYGASMLLTVMSPRYVQDRGGWASSYTMNRVYNNVVDLEKQRQTKKALRMFKKKSNVKRI